MMSEQSYLRWAPLLGTGSAAPDPSVDVLQMGPVWLAFLAFNHQLHTILCPSILAIPQSILVSHSFESP